MSFVGCVGTLMAESELYEIMESTFGGVSKLLNGKKFPQNMRALRLVVEELLRSLFNTEDLTSYHDLERALEDVAYDSKTAKVWVFCLIRAVFIIMVYVRAERKADWPLHIQAMKFMMPISSWQVISTMPVMGYIT